MKLKDALDNYYFHSGKTSDIVRQLGFGGIALIWLFKYEADGRQIVPPELIPTGALIVLGLGLDLLHYLFGTVAWGIYHRVKENQGVTAETDFLAPSMINWPALFCFWSKTLIMGVAYVKILIFLAHRIV